MCESLWIAWHGNISSTSLCCLKYEAAITLVKLQKRRSVFKRCSVFKLLADHFINEIKARFNQLTTTTVSRMLLLPENAIKPNGIANASLTNWRRPSALTCQRLQQDVDRWLRRWQKVDQQALPKSLSEAYRTSNNSLYPNVASILHLLHIAPVTSASVERANSALDYVKKELRSTMGQDRLNDLILLYVRKDIALNYENVIDRIASKAPRRMLLRDPINHPDDE